MEVINRNGIKTPTLKSHNSESKAVNEKYFETVPLNSSEFEA